MPRSASEGGTVKGHCCLCGWRYEYTYQYNYSVHWSQSRGTYKIPRHCEFGDPVLTLAEIGTHLKSQFSDIYNLPFRLFEELVNDFFRQAGFQALLTKQTRDGGADIILLGGADDITAIVEVKRFAADRAVGIGLVDRLLGATLRWDVRKAYLVTTSKFSRMAIDAVASVNAAESNLDLELWDAGQVLSQLQCYNEDLPPLHLMDPERLQDAISDADDGLSGPQSEGQEY